MVNKNLDFEQFQIEAEREDGCYSDHLRRLLVVLAKDHTLLEVMKEILRSNPCANEEAFYRLRSAGILTGHSAVDGKQRCQLYAKYLRRHLL